MVVIRKTEADQKAHDIYSEDAEKWGSSIKNPSPEIIGDDAKFIYPIPPEGINHDDAVRTLTLIEESRITLDSYNETGNGNVGDLFIDLYSDSATEPSSPDGEWGSGQIPGKRKKLINMLEYALDSHTPGGKSCTDDDIIENMCFFDYEYNADYPWRTEEYAVQEHKVIRLLIRLVWAYREWAKTDATYTTSQLKIKPLTK